MLKFKERGSVTFDYGNNIRGDAKDKWSWKMPLISLALFLRLFVLFSVMEKDLSAGQQYLEILKTFTKLTKHC